MGNAEMDQRATTKRPTCNDRLSKQGSVADARGSGSRVPLERVMQIDRSIQNKEFPNCSTLAVKFEVTARTIQRDIEFLKERMNRAVAFDPTQNGYYYTTPVEKSGQIQVTESELFSLIVAYKAVAQFRRTPFKAPLETALQKLTGPRQDNAFTLGSMDRLVSFRPFGPEQSNGEALQLFTNAIQSRTAVEFQYRKVGAKDAKRRRVHPYHIACIDSQFYLLAYDVARRAIRTFVVARVREAKLREETFVMPAHFNPTEYLRGSFGAFSGNEDYEVVIDFDRFAADLIRDRQWHVTQKITERAGGGIRFEMRVNSLKEVERWVLSWGEHAMVSKPAALCNRVHEVFAEMNARYLRQLKEEAARPVEPRGN